MLVNNLHWTEIDSHALDSASTDIVSLKCSDCGSVYSSGDDWPGICKCGGQHWDFGAYYDHRDLNLVSNCVVL